MVTEMATLRDQQSNMEKMISDLNKRFLEFGMHIDRIDGLERAVKSLQAKVADIDDRSRRSNLVLFGIQEGSSETETTLRAEVIDSLFWDKLNVRCSSVVRIHRIGKPGKMRPVIVSFQNYNEKQDVLKNARKLKGTKIYIQNDYSVDTLRKRKLLWQSAKEEKKQGKKVILLHDKLRIDNELYVWDDVTHSRVELVTRRKVSSRD